MTPKSISILADPHPCGHIVYPYTDENLVAQAVCLYASAGLGSGEGVILIMAKPHFYPIERRLLAEGFDTEALQRTGQLVCIAAEDLLPAFMIDGAPDDRLFKSAIGGIIHRVKVSVTNGHAGKVRAFGEMVSLLWNDNLAAAKRLEELWNEIIDIHSISLMCTPGQWRTRSPSAVADRLVF